MNHLPELIALLQIILIDLSMAGDNAIVVGMAAAGLPLGKRQKAVIAGIAGATVFRILFALFAVQILRITGLLVAGGLLLLWVGWKMYLELQHLRKAKLQVSSPHKAQQANAKTTSAAIWQIIIADVSMSLDNVLGVAGVARDHLWILAAGLTLSVLMMGVASSFIARLAAKHNWIGYLGLAVILYTALRMIGDGLKVFLSINSF